MPFWAQVALSHDLGCARWYRTSGHYGLEKFHVTFMQQLTNVWSAGVYEICAVTDRWSFLTVSLGNLSVRPP